MSKSLKKEFFYLLIVFSGLLLALFSAALVTTSYFIEEEVAFQRLLLEAKDLKVEYEKGADLSTSNQHLELYLGFDQLPKRYQTELKEKTFGEIQFQSEGKQYYFYHFYIAIDQEAYLISERSSFKFFEKISNELLIVFLTMTPLTLILAATIWWLLGRKAVEPLSELTESIQVIEDESIKIPENILLLDNEIGVLANRLEDSYGELVLAIEREREFTRDVSHELRTPIAVIMNELRLSGESALKSQAKALVWEQLSLINSRIDILFALARSESLLKKDIYLLTAIEESILSIHQLIEEQKFDIEVNVDRIMKLHTNSNLLSLMLSNLIENAIKYSLDGRMTIGADTEKFWVSNKTDSIVDQNILNKRVTKGDGIGQGLFLIRRIVETLDGRIEVKVEKEIFTLYVFL